MRHLLIFFTIISFTFFPKITCADEMVTVKLVNYLGDNEKVNVTLEGDFHSLDSSLFLKEGVKYELTFKNDLLILEGDGEKYQFDGPFTLLPNVYDERHIIYINDRPYIGSIEFLIEEDQYIRPINQLPLEDYLKGVVPFEVFPSWELETLKAQTLAARTYAVTHMNKEMDDTIRFQVYGGYTWHENTTKAIEETKGEVITYNDRLIDAFYSASNGGQTESNAHVWGGKALSYFPIKKDPFDPIHPWDFTLKKEQISLEEIDWDDTDWWALIEEVDTEITSSLKNWLYNKGYSNDIKILSIPRFNISEKQFDSGRSIEGAITVEFLQRLLDGTVMYEVLVVENGNLNRVRPMIGGNVFKSYLIDMFKDGDKAYTIKGRGFGHGVGMSQWGAQVMGQQGKTYEEILQFYYPGTEIKKVIN